MSSYFDEIQTFLMRREKTILKLGLCLKVLYSVYLPQVYLGEDQRGHTATVLCDGTPYVMCVWHCGGQCRSLKSFTFNDSDQCEQQRYTSHGINDFCEKYIEQITTVARKKLALVYLFTLQK